MDSSIPPSKSVNTLDMIEECLNLVHNSRKSYALSNSRKLKEQQRKMRGAYSAKYDKTSDFVINDEEDKTKEEDDEQLEKEIVQHKNNDDDVKLLEEMANSFSSPPIQPAPYQKPPDAADVNAQIVMDDFCEELQEFIETSSNVNDDETRADYADFLIDKYLAQNLDTYEKSAAISRIRKSISYSIERFAISGLFEVPAGAKVKKSLKEGKDQNLQKPAPSGTTKRPASTSENKSIANNSQSRPSVADAGSNLPEQKPKTHLPMTAEEKAKQEKQKMKEQYEAFMNLKKKTETHPDVQSINQYTDLNDDIMSLISSIKGGDK